MQDFEKLLVWQKAHQLALDVDKVIEEATARRYVGLRAQLLRAAASVPANIAEGCGKSTSRELARFAEIALASLTELANHLRFAHDVGVIGPAQFDALRPRVAEVRRMLFSFVRAVRARAARP